MALKFSHGMAFGVRKKSSELLLKKRRTHIKGHKNIERERERELVQSLCHKCHWLGAEHNGVMEMLLDSRRIPFHS